MVFLNNKRLSWKARGILAWLHAQPKQQATLRELIAAGGTTGSYAARTGIDELVREGYVSFTGDVIEVLSHPVEGGVYARPGQFHRMEILAIGTYCNKTVMVALMDNGNLFIQEPEIWDLIFNNPKVPIEHPQLLDRIEYRSEYRGHGRWIDGQSRRVYKVDGNVILKPNDEVRTVLH